TITGTGGANSGGSDYGVDVVGNGSQVTSNGGNVSVTGHGGGTGSSRDNVGVKIEGGAMVTAGGSGTVTVTGTGGSRRSNGQPGVRGINYALSAPGQIQGTPPGGGGVPGTGTAGSGGSAAAVHTGGMGVTARGMITAGGLGTVAVAGSAGSDIGFTASNFGVK